GATGRPEKLPERGEEDRRPAGAARQDIGHPRGEPVRERKPADDDKTASEHRGEYHEPAIARIEDGGDRQTHRGPDKELRLREHRERAKGGAAGVSRDRKSTRLNSSH